MSVTVDAGTVITALMLALNGWGLLRFVAQVDRLEKRVDDCCSTHRRATDSKTARRR